MLNLDVSSSPFCHSFSHTKKAKLPTFLLPQVRIPSNPESQNLFIAWPGAQSPTNLLIPQPLPNLSPPLLHHLCVFPSRQARPPIRNTPPLYAKSPILTFLFSETSRDKKRKSRVSNQEKLGLLIAHRSGKMGRTGRMEVSVWRGGVERWGLGGGADVGIETDLKQRQR
jgi:hypothetical protein